MYSVKGTTIKMTRGDTFIATVTLKLNGQTYIPNANDVIRFMVGYRPLNSARTAYATEGVIFEKIINNNTMILRIDPDDTKEMDFGSYVYDMEITFSDGRVDTFIEGATFTITPEID